MAESPESGDALDRYAAIEIAYRAERWFEVLDRGQALLQDLDPADVAGVRERLQLLLGHTHLHGLGDRAAAARCYREVLAVSTDPRLRQSAEEELRSCGIPETAAPSAAAPWLEDAAAGAFAAAAGREPLIPEVVEEPELIEVHQADPRLAEDLELPMKESEPEDDPELRRCLMRVVLP